MNIIDEIEKQIKDLENLKFEVQTNCSHPEAAVTSTCANPHRDPLCAERRNMHCNLCKKEWSKTI